MPFISLGATGIMIHINSHNPRKLVFKNGPFILLIFVLHFAIGVGANDCDIPIFTQGKARPGRFVLAPFDLNHNHTCLIMINEKGEQVFSRSNDTVTDFRPEPFANGKLFSFMQISDFIPIDAWFGSRHIMDESFHEVALINFQLPTDVGNMDMNSHEFVYFGPDHFAALYYLPEIDFVGRCIIRAEVLEMKNGVEVFKWTEDSVNFPFQENSTDAVFFRKQKCFDNLHINSFQKLESPTGYLISARNGNWIGFIPKYSPQRSWYFGGELDEFGIEAKAQFHGQHGANLDTNNNTLILFDNGINPMRKNESLATGFRVLEFKLDLEKKKVISWKEVYKQTGPSLLMGYVEKCGESCYDVSTGYAQGPDFIEYEARQAKTTFKLWIGTRKNSATDKKYGSYRVYRVNQK